MSAVRPSSRSSALATLSLGFVLGPIVAAEREAVVALADYAAERLYVRPCVVVEDDGRLQLQISWADDLPALRLDGRSTGDLVSFDGLTDLPRHGGDPLPCRYTGHLVRTALPGQGLVGKLVWRHGDGDAAIYELRLAYTDHLLVPAPGEGLVSR